MAASVGLAWSWNPPTGGEFHGGGYSGDYHQGGADYGGGNFGGDLGGIDGGAVSEVARLHTKRGSRS